MQTGVVEEVALDPPHLAVHLVPFRARFAVDLHIREVERARSRRGGGARRHDSPASSWTIEERLLAVRRHGNPEHPFHKLFGFTLGQVELLNSLRPAAE